MDCRSFVWWRHRVRSEDGVQPHVYRVAVSVPLTVIYVFTIPYPIIQRDALCYCDPGRDAQSDADTQSI